MLETFDATFKVIESLVDSVKAIGDAVDAPVHVVLQAIDSAGEICIEADTLGIETVDARSKVCISGINLGTK